MKIIGVNLSNNTNSINKVMLSNVIQHLDGEQIEFEKLDWDMLKIGDKEPDTLDEICKKIKDADKIIFTTPEYNGSYSAYGKNILDWISTKGTFDGSTKITPLSGKQVMLIATAPGLLGGIRCLPSLNILINELGGIVIKTFATTGGFDKDNYDYSNVFKIADDFKSSF